MKFGLGVQRRKLASVNNSIGVVILARYSSSRLPGKALMEIEGKKVLRHILDRLLKVIPIEKIILATSDLASDDALEQFALMEGIKCHRGSLKKVGERFYEAAQILDCDYTIRMNGDNIFLDPEILSQMMTKAGQGNFNFLSNVKGRSFPKGMSVEIVRNSYYAQHLEQIKADDYCNEHVMACLYQEPVPEDHYYQVNEALPKAAGIQLALDTPEDLERTKYMLARIPVGDYTLRSTFEYYQEYGKSLKG